MKSIGELLRTTRQEKGYSLEEVAHETNISRHYLEALESEDFDSFPAEAYLMGFLRNYADFLGIDSGKLINLYRSYKLSEEPAPMAELVGKKIDIPWKIILPVLAGIVLVVLALSIIPPAVRAAADRKERSDGKQISRPPQEHLLEADFLEAEILEGDTLSIEVDDGTSFVFKVLVKGKKVQLKGENPELFKGRESLFTLGRGEEVFIMLVGDSPDVRVFLKELDGSENTGVLQVQRIEKPTIVEEGGNDNEMTTLSQNVDKLEPPSGASQRKVEKVVILTAKKPENLTINVTFKGFCLLRYKIDNAPAEEKYFKDGDALRLDVYRGVRLWASNAGAISAKVKDVDLILGGPGEVTVRQLQWVKNDSGAYDLVILPVY
jgi:cytoskeletal protein RodZ